MYQVDYADHLTAEQMAAYRAAIATQFAPTLMPKGGYVVKTHPAGVFWGLEHDCAKLIARLQEFARVWEQDGEAAAVASLQPKGGKS